ncbi:ATP-grasp domain-containing protein [Alkalilimnicola ehrlichii MLHE-1]|uniref:carboxylate--amine ligase n=1 Tax=Alkalilimnicola ehrlichii TaxID=351052 RepID=UPI0012EA4279|nr:ATP-grasp domain-containing protein [Alkalilimnicola ehrlichii]
MRDKTVLILGCFPRISVPIAQCLKNHGFDVYVGDIGSNPRNLYSNYIDGLFKFSSPERSGDCFLSEIVRFIDEFQVDFVVPVSDGELSALAKYEDQLRSRAVLLLPEARKVRAVLDKAETLRLAKNLSIPAPETFYVSGEDDLDVVCENASFPVVVKPSDRSVATPLRARHAKNEADLRAILLPHIGSKIMWLVQEYLPGQGVGVEVLFWNGEARVIFQHRRLKELPVTGGVAVRCISEKPDQKMVAYALSLLSEIGWEGLAMVEFRQDPVTGRVGLMEINGRCWGSISLPIKCGIEFPYYAVILASGEEIEFPERYPLGQKMRWLSGDLERSLQLLAQVRHGEATLGCFFRDASISFSDFFGDTKDALWSWRDPCPAMEDLRFFLRGLIRRVVKKF